MLPDSSKPVSDKTRTVQVAWGLYFVGIKGSILLQILGGVLLIGSVTIIVP